MTLGLEGERGRVLAPVGQARTLLPVGSCGRWRATVQAQVQRAAGFGPYVGRAASWATFTGEAEGWRENAFYWPALAEPRFTLELEERALVWVVPVRLTIQEHRIRFSNDGPAHCRAKEGRTL